MYREYNLTPKKNKLIKATPNQLFVRRARSHQKIQIENFGKNAFSTFSSNGKLVNFQYKDKGKYEKMSTEKTLKMPKLLPDIAQGRIDHAMVND